MQYGAVPEDAHDLFYRMVFNVLLGNTDDHAKNRALLYCFSKRHWRLSPAYDVLPVNNSKMHGIGLGDHRRFGESENLLCQSERFGLKRHKAAKIIKTVRELVIHWPYYMGLHGVGTGDMERLKSVIPNTSEFGRD
jgi:serine/threonine-protein kinase HipA